MAKELRAAGFEVFDDWQAVGPEADDYWKQYEQARGRTYLEALKGHAARNVFEFDRRHLDAADAVVCVYPAGRSAHLELGYSIGQGKPGWILFDEESANNRWDIMVMFATGIHTDAHELVEEMKEVL